jgi:peptidoglycan/xylan/chitin deacetylase (PgdA/CDA1 family)
MRIRIAIGLSAFLVCALAAAAQDSESYCRYVQEQAQADNLKLRTPSAVAGITQPNTGTAPQLYSGVSGSLADYRKGQLTLEAARQNCQLYKSTNEAQQAINYAAAYLEQQALSNRIALDRAALKKIQSLIDQNELMIRAQSATKLSLYALQSAKAHLAEDQATSQRALIARTVPDLPDVPLYRLVMMKQADEEHNQTALAKLARQDNWDVRWEAGFHRTINNSNGLVASDGPYGGFTATYNLGSKKIDGHLDAAAKSYAEWKRQEENDVVASAEELRQQLAEAIRAEGRRWDDLKVQQKALDENLSLVQEVSTGAAITFANQLASDRLMLDVEMKDSQYRLTSLRDYLAYNFDVRQENIQPVRVSITFDDGFESAFQKALPILDAAGIKGTWYIITKSLGQKDYLTAEQVGALANDGQEVGAHTQHHPHLATLTMEQQQQEIGGSMRDLQSLGINVKSFAYPFGEHNDDSLAAVQASGFTSARTTDRNLSGRNAYLLEGYSITPETTFEDIERYILQAQARGAWVILTFHRIDDDGNPISARHELLQRIVDYTVRNHIAVTTVTDEMNRRSSAVARRE